MPQLIVAHGSWTWWNIDTWICLLTFSRKKTWYELIQKYIYSNVILEIYLNLHIISKRLEKQERTTFNCHISSSSLNITKWRVSNITLWIGVCTIVVMNGSFHIKVFCLKGKKSLSLNKLVDINTYCLSITTFEHWMLKHAFYPWKSVQFCLRTRGLNPMTL